MALNEWQSEEEVYQEIYPQYPPANPRPNPSYGGGRPPSSQMGACSSIAGFVLNSFKLLPQHYDAIRQLAQQIVAIQASPAPVRAIRLIGHTDKSGPETYNQKLGLDRAQTVERTLRGELENLRPGITSQINITSNSLGESQATSNFDAASRGVKICLVRIPRHINPPPPPPPPPVCHCPKCGGGGGGGGNMQCFFAVQRTIFMAIRNLKAVAAACRRQSHGQSHGCRGNCGHRR